MKQIFLAAIFLFFALPNFGQAEFCPKVSYSLTQLNFEEGDIEVASRPGYSIGADFRFGERLYFNPGLFYHVMSKDIVDVSEQGIGNPIKDIYGLKCLKLPILLGLNLVNGDAFRFRIAGGATGYQRLGINKKQPGLSKDLFQRRFWGANGRLGFDIFFVTLDFGVEFGQSGIFRDLPKEKYTTFELSAGFRLF